MLEFQEKKKLRKILYSKATLIALFVIIIFVARAALGVYHKQKTSENNLINARKEVLGLENREKMLNFEIDRLKTSEGNEEEIRKKFMVGKTGEQVIIIVDDIKSSSSDKIENTKGRGIWAKFIDLFR